MVNMILATSEDNGLGKDGRLPWDRDNLDMKIFKTMTTISGHERCYTGSNTALTLPKLKGRDLIILSRNPSKYIDSSECMSQSITDVCEIEKGKLSPGWIIGGSKIYEASLKYNLVTGIIIHITIKGDHEHDVSFDLEGNLSSRYKYFTTQVPDASLDSQIKRIDIYKHEDCPKDYIMGISDIIYYQCLHTY